MSTNRLYAVGAGACALGLVLFVLVIYGFAELKSRQAPKPGYIGVCQTGGPIEGNSDTCGVAQPGSGKRTWGAFNDLRLFPSTQRNFTLADVQGAEGKPLTLTTKDGVNVSVSVRYLFTLDRDKVVDFYRAYGQREYNGKHVYDYQGGGWDNFLRSEFTPIATQSLRKQILESNCADLNPQCAVLGKKVSAGGKVADANVNLTKIQEEAGVDFADGLTDTLGGEYFTDVRVASLLVRLPNDMQQQVNAANAAKAKQIQAEAEGQAAVAKAEADAKVQVTKARADRDQALLSAQGLRAQAKAYAKNPAKAQVDAVAALPRNITTLVMGGKQLIQVPAR